MNSNTKNKTLVWIIVILLATNLSTIGSFYYHRMKEPKTTETKQDSQTVIPGERRTRFFKEQLNLDTNQLVQFREINRTFNRTARGIEMNLAQLREDMIKELGARTPDSTRLQQIAADVGNNHQELKQVTITFYLNMKRICNAEQQAKLHELFQSMLNKDSQINLPQPGYQGRGWHN